MHKPYATGGEGAVGGHELRNSVTPAHKRAASRARVRGQGQHALYLRTSVQRHEQGYRNRQDKTSDISPCPFALSVHGPSEAGLSRAFCPPFPNLPMLGFSLGDSNILRYRAATRSVSRTPYPPKCKKCWNPRRGTQHAAVKYTVK